MSEKDTIKDLFSDKLNGLESQVRPELWENISSQLGSVSAASGVSVITKVAMGITAAASFAVVGYFTYNGDSQPKKAPSKTEEKSVLKQVKEVENTIKNATSSSDRIALVNENLIEQTTTLSDFAISFDPEKVDYIIEPEASTSSSPVIETVHVEQQMNTEVQPINQEEALRAESIQQVSAVEIILPNTFTPNGDGVNEFLTLDLPLDKINEGSFSCVVIDRYGKTVFQTTDINFQWDGLSMSGDPVSVGDYVYYITAEDRGGLIISKYSMLHIVR